MSGVLVGLTIVTAVASGLIGGVFFAFSTFVMSALARVPTAQGIAAMQAINVQAVTPAFMLALFGTAAACAALGVWAVADWGEAFAPYLLVGSGLYLAGVVVLTITYHVPRNNALARLDQRDVDADTHWSGYVARWTAWNHARTLSALAASALYAVALRVG